MRSPDFSSDITDRLPDQYRLPRIDLPLVPTDLTFHPGGLEYCQPQRREPVMPSDGVPAADYKGVADAAQPDADATREPDIRFANIVDDVSLIDPPEVSKPVPILASTAETDQAATGEDPPETTAPKTGDEAGIKTVGSCVVAPGTGLPEKVIVPGEQQELPGPDGEMQPGQDQMPVSADDFSEELERQGVVLDTLFDLYREFAENNAEPPELTPYVTIAAKERTLNGNNARLSSGPIEAPTSWQRDASVMALVGLLNCEHIKPDPAEFDAVINTHGAIAFAECCPDAELRFADVLNRLKSTDTENYDHLSLPLIFQKCQIILGDADQPVAMQKIHAGARSCLVLRPIIVNDIPIPPGFLLAIRTREKPKLLTSINEVTGVGLLRPSNFMLSCEGRTSEWSYITQRILGQGAVDLALSVTMPEIRATVDSVTRRLMAVLRWSK